MGKGVVLALVSKVSARRPSEVIPSDRGVSSRTSINCTFSTGMFRSEHR
jgi:hypothetical protein